MHRLGETDPVSVGGYPLFARLGAGGMGQVYLARTPAGRPLALKTVRPEFALDPAFGERFDREIRHADRVRSPWTVTVVDFSPAGSRPQWLATEYVAAPSLADWVSVHGPLPAPSLAALAAELCEALHEVHRADLTHRDVKPSNVLLAGDRPLLIDFGIARAADDSRYTRTGGVIGSPGYMAPEQATAGMSAAPSDVFALGSVLVYAATGRGPFNRLGEQPSTPALLYRVVHEEPDLAGVPEPLLPLVRACLSKRPEDRPTARSADTLLPEDSAGQWGPRKPPGLAAELVAREAATLAALNAPAAARASAPVSTVTAAASSPIDPRLGIAVSPGPSQHSVPRSALASPARAFEPAAMPGPVPPPSPEAHEGGKGREDTTAPGPPEKGPSPRRRRLLGVAAGSLAAVAVAGLLVHRLLDSDADRTGSGTGNPASAGPSTRTPSADPNALPASWVGTWFGTGPGNPDGKYMFGLRTDSYKVTITFHAGRIGQVVGQQVSHVHDQDTGKDDGCTESLELTAIDAGSMKFAAKSPHTTDPASTLVCAPGNTYEVSMIEGRLHLGPGSQGLGAPTTFARRSPHRNP